MGHFNAANGTDFHFRGTNNLELFAFLQVLREERVQTSNSFLLTQRIIVLYFNPANGAILVIHQGIGRVPFPAGGAPDKVRVSGWGITPRPGVHPHCEPCGWRF